MPKIEIQKKTKIEDSTSLKGTLASVMLLGFFIIITWLGVYFLFLERL
ncbi:cytochrome c oxidase subunit 2A [Bacillus timonensis]|nr:cytochrome c oxidase subunit 2A [Bacillus timonensis]